MQLIISIALVTLAAFAAADVSHLKRTYLPPSRTSSFTAESGYSNGAENFNGAFTAGTGFSGGSGLSGKLIAAPAAVSQQQYSAPLRTYSSAPATQSFTSSNYVAPSSNYLAPTSQFQSSSVSAPLRTYSAAQPVPQNTQTYSSSSFSGPSANYVAPVSSFKSYSAPAVQQTYGAPSAALTSFKSYAAPAVTQTYAAPSAALTNFKSYSAPAIAQSYAAPSAALTSFKSFTAPEVATQNYVAPASAKYTSSSSSFGAPAVGVAPSFGSFAAPGTGAFSAKYSNSNVNRNYLAPEVETFAPLVQKTYSSSSGPSGAFTSTNGALSASGIDTKYAVGGGYVY